MKNNEKKEANSQNNGIINNALGVRSVDYSLELFDYYSKRCRVEVVYKKGTDEPEMLKIYQTQRNPFRLRYPTFGFAKKPDTTVETEPDYRRLNEIDWYDDE